MKSKFIKYSVTSLVIAVSFWCYFQIDTYPYKVDRWLQPLEARLVATKAKQCLSSGSWLKLALDGAAFQHGAYSAQVAFIDAEKKISTCEIGYKNKLFGVSLSERHRYRYASVSKLITTTIILRLEQQGRIGLDDSLIGFLPELIQFQDQRIRQITIEDLLNHRAGFDRLVPSGDPMFLRRNKPWCPNDLQKLQTVRLTSNPGGKQTYSNIGFCLLGEVVHRVTDESYRSYVEQVLSLAKYDIKFINNFYYDDEARYDFRHEELFDNTYLALFDFEALSSAAGLSGSASALATLLWDIHHDKSGSPFLLKLPVSGCNLLKVDGCLSLGVNHYQPNPHGLMLHYHRGYLPGSSSFAVIDSFGGVTVLVMSGADRPQQNPQNEWIRWTYNRLSLYYTLQGKLPILNSLTKVAGN